jgi:hypothetical protein
MHRLSFAHVHSYANRDASITVSVVLRSGERVADLVASIDTGASQCLFESAYAGELGLELTSGIFTRFRTANSSFDAYGHEIEIEVMGMVTRSLVYFFAEHSIRKNVLGRGGWLDRVRAWVSLIMTARSTWPITTTTETDRCYWRALRDSVARTSE